MQSNWPGIISEDTRVTCPDCGGFGWVLNFCAEPCTRCKESGRVIPTALGNAVPYPGVRRFLADLKAFTERRTMAELDAIRRAEGLELAAWAPFYGMPDDN